MKLIKKMWKRFTLSVVLEVILYTFTPKVGNYVCQMNFCIAWEAVMKMPTGKGGSSRQMNRPDKQYFCRHK